MKHVKAFLDGFVGQSDAALRSDGVLQQEWATLSADLDKAIADLDRDPGSLGLVAMLNEAKGDWEEAFTWIGPYNDAQRKHSGA